MMKYLEFLFWKFGRIYVSAIDYGVAVLKYCVAWIRLFVKVRDYRRYLYLTAKIKYSEWKIEQSLKLKSKITGIPVEDLKKINGIDF